MTHYPDALAFAADFREAIGLNRTPSNVVELLTPREQEVLSLIMDGLANKEIAQRLTVTLGTVKWYVKQIYDKLGVRSRVQAMVRARELNLIVKSNQAAMVTPIPTDDFYPDNPYKGLRAFQAADHQDFFGRERVTAKLLKRLGDTGDYHRFLAVVGPSGSGKSSLVKAGLIPALWRGDLPGSEKGFIAEMLPGSRPIDELEIALTKIASSSVSNLHEHLQRDKFGLLRAASLMLPNDGSDLILIIDQFEEVFTLVDDEKVRTHFLDLLYAAVTEMRSRVRVIVTLRADFYDRPLHYPQFGELVRSRLETVLPLSAEELENAIVKPAERAGVTFEAGLVSSIVADVKYQAGALPLLQYALTELFERRQGRLLTSEAYQAIGGTVGALAKRAEALYLSLSDAGQEATRQMFLRLVTLGDGTEDTRRRVARSELLTISSDSDLMEEVLDTYTEYRLLASDNDPTTRTPTVEVAHEALLREWERLRVWLNDNREEIRLERQLTSLGAEWYEANQDASFLLRGSRLETLEKWAAQTSLVLTPRERAYLNASITTRESEHNAEQLRIAREKSLERRSMNGLRALVGVLIVAFIGALILSGVAITNANAARDNEAAAIAARDESETNYQIAEARRLAGASTLLLPNAVQNAELAALLALRSLNTVYSAEADTALTQSSNMLYTERVLNIPEGLSFSLVVMSPDETTLAMGDAEGSIHFLDAATLAEVGQLPPQGAAINMIVYSPDGQRLLTSYETDTVEVNSVQVWDVETAVLIREFLIEDGTVTRGYFMPDGQTIVIAPDSYIHSSVPVYVLSVETGEEINTFTDRASATNFSPMALSPNGEQIVYFDGYETLMARSMADNALLFTLHGSGVIDIRYAPNGELLGVADDRSIRIYNTQTGEMLQEIVNPTGDSITRVLFTPDSSKLAGVGSRALYVWDAATGMELRRFTGGTCFCDFTFFDHGNHALTLNLSGDTSEIRIWNTDLNYLSNAYPVVAGFAPGESEDGSMFAVATDIIRIYAAESGEVLRELPNDSDPMVFWLTFSPDNQYLFGSSGGDPAVLRVWDLTTGETLWQINWETGTTRPDISPDGSYVATPHNDGVTRLWDLQTGTLIREYHSEYDSSWDANFSADGLLLATSGVDGTAQVWSVETGARLQVIQASDSSVYYVEFSPDQRLLATLDNSPRMSLWDLASGERVLDIDQSFTYDGAFSPDGHYFATVVDNNQLTIWDTQTFQVMRRIFSPHSAATFLWFTQDSQTLVVGNWDQTFSTFDVHLDAVIAETCARLFRDFTEEERAQYYIADDNPTCEHFGS